MRCGWLLAILVLGIADAEASRSDATLYERFMAAERGSFDGSFFF